MRVKEASGALALTLALTLGGCGGGGDAEKDVELVEGVTVEVQVLDNRFVPADTTVKPGTHVKWTNDGRNDHNILPAEEGAFEGVGVEDLHPGDDATIRFTEPGTYPYYCSIHGTDKAGMVGTLVVEA